MTSSNSDNSRNGASRREFLATAGTAAAAVAASPLILNATDKSGGKTPRVGSGEHTYEVHHNWGKLPGHVRWGDTHGVCVDAAGQVYIKHRARGRRRIDAIVVFDEKGKYVRSFGKEYHGAGHGIDLRREGGEEFLYLSCIGMGIVVKTTLMGEQVWKIGRPDRPATYQNKQARYSPTNLAFAADGGIYVGDGYGSHFIHQYDAKRNLVRTWGGFGSKPGQMKTPHGIWLDDRPGRKPSLVVADRANARLQYFSLDGEHLGFVAGLSFPADIDTQGEIMLVPDLHARISLFDKHNKLISHLGYDPAWTKKVLANGLKLRRNPGQYAGGRFVHPHDACFDKAGNIYVAEWVPQGRVSFLRKVS